MTEAIEVAGGAQVFNNTANPIDTAWKVISKIEQMNLEKAQREAEAMKQIAPLLVPRSDIFEQDKSKIIDMTNAFTDWVLQQNSKGIDVTDPVRNKAAYLEFYRRASEIKQTSEASAASRSLYSKIMDDYKKQNPFSIDQQHFETTLKGWIAKDPISRASEPTNFFVPLVNPLQELTVLYREAYGKFPDSPKEWKEGIASALGTPKGQQISQYIIQNKSIEGVTDVATLVSYAETIYPNVENENTYRPPQPKPQKSLITRTQQGYSNAVIGEFLEQEDGSYAIEAKGSTKAKYNGKDVDFTPMSLSSDGKSVTGQIEVEKPGRSGTTKKKETVTITEDQDPALFSKLRPQKAQKAASKQKKDNEIWGGVNEFIIKTE